MNRPRKENELFKEYRKSLYIEECALKKYLKGRPVKKKKNKQESNVNPHK